MAVELASGYVSLVPSTKGFGAALDKQIGPEVDKAARDAGTRAGDGFTSSFGAGLGKLAAIAATAFAGLQVGGFIKDSITAASDLSETVNKVAVVFGDSAPIVQEWGKTAATALGQSQQQALEAAGTFGNLFRAMGLTSDVSADMSTKLINLAGDLASFNNANPADVLIALKSGLVGETEPLRQFGVNLNDIRIKAEAARLGLVNAAVDQDKLSAASEAADKAARKVADTLKKNGEGSQEFADATRDAEQANSKLADVMGGKMPTQLDAATKAQAVYSLIMQDTTLAQGDFARTSDGLANQLRILQAQFKDSSAKIGQAFLPIALKVVKFLTSTGIPAFSKFGEAMATKIAHAVDVATVALQIFRKELDPSTATTKGFHNLNDVFAHLGDIVRKVRDGIKIFKQTLDKSVKANPGIHNLNDIFAHVADFVAKASDKLRAFGHIVKTAVDAFRAGFNGQVGAAGLIGTIETIGAKARQFFQEDIPNFVNDALGAFHAFVDGFKDGFKDGVTNLDNSGLQGRIEDIAGQVGALAHFLKTDVPDAIGAFVDGFRNGFDDIDKGTKFEKFEHFGDTVKSIVDTIKDNKDIFGAIAGAITGFATALVLVSKVSPVFSALSGVLGNLGTVVGILTSPLGIVVGLLAGLAAAAFFAYKKFTPFRAAVDSVVQTFKRAGFGAAVDEAGTQFGRLFEIVKPKLIEFRDKVFAWLKDHGPEIFAGLGTAIGGVLSFLGTEVLGPLGSWIKDTAAPWLKDKISTEWAPAFYTWIKDTAIPQTLGKLPEFVNSITQWIKDHKGEITKVTDTLSDALVDWIENQALPALKERLPEITNAILAFFTDNADPLARGLGVAFVEQFTVGIIEHLPDLAIKIPGMLGIIGLAIVAGIVAAMVGPEGTELFGAGLGTLVGFISGLPQKIADAAVGMWHGVTDAFNVIFTSDISADKILGFFTDLPGRISAAAVGMWDGIPAAFKEALNTVIRLWNSLPRFEIPGFDPPGPGSFPGFSFGAPHIDELAGGGVFTSKTTGLFSLAETPAARPEIVTPQKLLAQTFRKELATVGAGGGGGVQFGDIVVNGAQASPSSIADAVFAKAGWLHFTGRREL